MSNPIGFGTWPLGGQAYGPIKDEVAIYALEEAIEQGIVLFDTADIYGDGKAETLLGQTINNKPDVIIVSKAGYISESKSDQDFSEKSIRLALDGSLKRLNRHVLDIFLLHSPTSDELKKGKVQILFDNLREEGIVSKTGISLRNINTFKLALEWPGCQVIELIFNLLDQRPLDLGIIKEAKERNIKIIARVPLCFGFLCGKYRRNMSFPKNDQRRRWSRKQINAWIDGANEFSFLKLPNRSITQAALAFCLSIDGISWVIPGMKTNEQVKHNVIAGEPELSLTESEFIKARCIWQSLKHIPPS